MRRTNTILLTLVGLFSAFLGFMIGPFSFLFAVAPPPSVGGAAVPAPVVAPQLGGDVQRAGGASSALRSDVAGMPGADVSATAPPPLALITTAESQVPPTQNITVESSLLADFASFGGQWIIRPNNSQYEPVRQWVPKHAQKPQWSELHRRHRGGNGEGTDSILSSSDSSAFRPWRRFDQLEALQCLSHKKILLVGNSNTRTLMTALQSLLEGVPQLSRVSAKQQCDNSKTNHSCWLTVDPNDPLVNGNITRGVRSIVVRRRKKMRRGRGEQQGQSGNGSANESVAPDVDAAVSALLQPLGPIHVHYVSYTGGLYDKADLEGRVATPWGFGADADNNKNGNHQQDGGSSSSTLSPPDVLIMNVGLNFLQKMWDEVWRHEHKEAIAPLQGFIRRYLSRSRSPPFLGRGGEGVADSDGNRNQLKTKRRRYGKTADEDSTGDDNEPHSVAAASGGVGSGSRRGRQSGGGGVFFWHTTTPLCRHMPHFRRYKYRKSNWQGRTFDNTNSAIEESNAVVRDKVLAGVVASSSSADNGSDADRLVLIDSHAMLSGADIVTPSALSKAKLVNMARHTNARDNESDTDNGGDAADGTGSSSTDDHYVTGLKGAVDDVCNSYDDPLHHRFFDRELVQVILNHYCP